MAKDNLEVGFFFNAQDTVMNSLHMYRHSELVILGVFIKTWFCHKV